MLCILIRSTDLMNKVFEFYYISKYTSMCSKNFHFSNLSHLKTSYRNFHQLSSNMLNCLISLLILNIKSKIQGCNFSYHMMSNFVNYNLYYKILIYGPVDAKIDDFETNNG